MGKLNRLSKEDVELLKGCIEALEDLEAGLRSPKTQLQRQFKRVTLGQMRASTNYEIAFMRWTQLREKSLRYCESSFEEEVHRLNIKATARHYMETMKKRKAQPVRYKDCRKSLDQEQSSWKPSDGLTLEDKEELIAFSRSLKPLTDKSTSLEPRSFKPRKIIESWGTRDDWRRDRARNKFNGR